MMFSKTELFTITCFVADSKIMADSFVPFINKCSIKVEFLGF